MKAYNEKDRKVIINEITNIIEEKQYSKTDVAKELKVSYSHFVNILNCASEPSDNLLIKISEYNKKERNEQSSAQNIDRPFFDLAIKLREWFTKQKRWKTQKELANHLGISYTTIRYYFQGRSYPNDEICKKLYHITNLDILNISNEKLIDNKIININDEPENTFNKLSQNIQDINKQLQYLRKQSIHYFIFSENTNNDNPHINIVNTFYKLAEELEYIKQSKFQEREYIRNNISPQDVGYVISFLKAIFDEDKFSDFIFFTGYDIKRKGEKIKGD